MKKVNRLEVMDYVTYGENRKALQEKIFPIKEARRIHVGPYLTFLFENKDTLLYQIQEMIRVERMVKEKDIQHEIDTYNQLIGNEGELGCTLLIEIDDPALRAQKLVEWLPLIDHLYLKLEDGSKIKAQYDPQQVGDRKLSAVQYLKFATGNKLPVAIGTDWGELKNETLLTNQQKQALAEDLK